MRYKTQFKIHAEVSRIWSRIVFRQARNNFTWISLCLLTLPIILLLPSFWMFPYPASGSQFSDLTISHFPNAVYLRNAILKAHEIPLWSSTILSGYPFVANPLSGLWYPVGWLALIIPLPLGFNLLVLLHLIWGGLGLYCLLKREGLSHAPALFAGITFTLLPKFFAHYGAGHLTLLYAVPWTPWLLFSQVNVIKLDDGKHRYRVPPGLILAIIFLADVRWGVFSTLIWWAYSIFHIQTKLSKTFLGLITQTFLTLLLIAPMLLPLLEYSNLSTRASLNPEEILVYSLTFPQLLGLLFPTIGGYHEWVLYIGGIVLMCAIAAISIRKVQRNELFWVGLFVMSILIALSGQIPGSSIIAQLPVINLLRVPSRTLFLAGLGLVALAGYGVEKLIVQPFLESTKRFKLILFFLLAFSICITAGIYITNSVLPSGVLWGLGMSLAGVFWIGVRVRSRIPIWIWLIGLFILAFVDLGVIDRFSFKSKSVKEVLNQADALTQYISSQPGLGRIYSPSYSIPQHIAIQHELQLADGVDPMQLESYVEFMEKATGVPHLGYSVTLPPFKTGNPTIDNNDYSPDAGTLGILNVGYLVADYDLNSDGVVLETTFDDTRVYKNTKQMPRAWVEVVNRSNELEINAVEMIEWTANRIALSAEGPGTLILAEIYYPGWQVWIDGKMGKIHTYNKILRSVPLDSGEHEVVFIFQPPSLLIGMVFCILGIIYLVRHFIISQ